MKAEQRQTLAAAIVSYLVVFGLSGFYTRPLAHVMASVSGFHGPTSSHHAKLAYVVGVVVISVLISAISLAAGIWVTYVATSLQVSGPLSLGLTIWFAGVWAAILFGIPDSFWRFQPRAAMPVAAVAYLALALAASFLGKLVALAFRDKNLVLGAAITGALVDFWGVNSRHGTTHALVSTHPEMVRHLSVHVPTLIPQIATTIGPGDYVFIGILLALVHRFQLNPSRTAIVIWILLVLSMVLVIRFGLPIPAVFPMGIAVIGTNLREFKFKRSEVFALVYAGALLAAIILVWEWVASRGVH